MTFVEGGGGELGNITSQNAATVRMLSKCIGPPELKPRLRLCKIESRDSGAFP